MMRTFLKKLLSVTCAVAMLCTGLAAIPVTLPVRAAEVDYTPIEIHPLCYRVWQTLLYHGAMTAFGLFSLCFGEVKLSRRACPRHLGLLSAMTLWALLGNTLYNGLNGRFYNWFFVVSDPFGILPAEIAPYLMPPLMVAILFGGEMLIHLIYHGVKRLRSPS